MTVSTQRLQRPWMLTTAMWAVLLVCIGAAALVVHLKAKLLHIDLAEPKKIGSVEVSLPRNWDVGYGRRGDSEEIEATEDRPPGRTLTIQTIDADAMETILARLDQEDIRQEEKLSIPNATGSIVHVRGAMPIALLQFDDGRGVTVQLLHRGQPAAEDDALIYQVAKSIRLGELPTPEIRRRPSPSHEI